MTGRQILDFIPILTAAAALIASGCQRQTAPDPVRIQLKWVHQAQFAGFYMAKEEGYYQDLNLVVEFLEGGPEVVVVEGRADLGIFVSEELLISHAEGQPVLAVPLIYQRNPLLFVSQRTSGIAHPADYENKTIAIAPDGMIQLRAMMSFLHLNINDVHLIPYSYDYQEFIEQEVDIAEVYSTGGLLRIEEEGISMNKIWPENYGVHFYGDTLFTTEAFAEKNSEVLERFLKASMKGWQKVIEEPAQAVDATMNYAREADPDLQRMMLQASIPLIHAGENKLGTISRERWFGMAAILNVKGQLDTLEVVDQVFDNSHPGLIYGDYQ